MERVTWVQARWVQKKTQKTGTHNVNSINKDVCTLNPPHEDSGGEGDGGVGVDAADIAHEGVTNLHWAEGVRPTSGSFAQIAW